MNDPRVSTERRSLMVYTRGVRHANLSASEGPGAPCNERLYSE